MCETNSGSPLDSWLQTLINDKDLRDRIACGIFQRFDVDQGHALSFEQVHSLTFEVSKLFGVEAPSEAKLRQVFDAVDKSRTNALSWNEFRVFWGGLLKGISTQGLKDEIFDGCIDIALSNLNGNKVLSLCLKANQSVSVLKESAAIELGKDVGFLDIASAAGLSEVFRNDMCVGEAVLISGPDLQVIVRESFRWKCDICEWTNSFPVDASEGSFLNKRLRTCCPMCTNLPPPAIMETLKRLQHDQYEGARERLQITTDKVNEAFTGVQLGNGLSLHEAVGYDWGQFPADCVDMSCNDARTDWRCIPTAAALQAASGKCRCGCEPGRSRFQMMQGTHYPFSFFDEEAFRFHLPAYLLAALHDSQRAEELMRVVLQNPYFHRKSTLFDTAQRRAVAACIMHFVELGYLDAWLDSEVLDDLESCYSHWSMIHEG